MKKNKLKFPLVAIGGLTFLLACGGDTNTDNSELNVVDSTATEATDEFADMFESPESDYQLPRLYKSLVFSKNQDYLIILPPLINQAC